MLSSCSLTTPQVAWTTLRSSISSILQLSESPKPCPQVLGTPRGTSTSAHDHQAQRAAIRATAKSSPSLLQPLCALVFWESWAERKEGRNLLREHLFSRKEAMNYMWWMEKRVL